MVEVSNCRQQEMPPKLAKIPPFPAVAVKLLSLLSHDDAGFASIVACIATDPVLSGKVIKRANAADMASYCEIGTVHQAVSALGVDRTREVSLTAATAGYAAAAIQRPCLQACWYHSLASALIASELARQCGTRPAEAYTAGLLHDIGRLGLLTAYPDQYEQIVRESAEQAVDLAEMEQRTFGVDHVEAGVWLAKDWGFPEALVEVMIHQKDAPSGGVNDTTIVRVACQLADFLGLAPQCNPSAMSFDEIAAPLPEWTRERLRAQLPVMKAAILKELGVSTAPDNQPAEAGENTACPVQPAGAEEASTAPEKSGKWGLALVAGAAFILVSVAVLLLRH